MKSIDSNMPFCESVSPWGRKRRVTLGIFLVLLAAGYVRSAPPIASDDPTLDEIPAGLDYSFTPAITEYWTVTALALQTDAKLLIAGSSGVLRLNSDGLLDSTFKPWIEGELTGQIIVQSDGRIIISGHNLLINDQPRRGVARLNPDGSLDKGFTANQTFSENSEAVVQAMALDAAGRIVVAVGNCNVIGNEKRSSVIRLNSNGTIDPSFSGPPDVCFVTSIVVQPDGRLLIAGPFRTVHGANRNAVARLNADGSLDLTFDPGTALTMAQLFSQPQNTLALQPDGRVLLAGTVFQIVNDEISRNGIARLNSDGSVDPSFDPGRGFDGPVHSVVLQADGKILVGGRFSAVDEQPRTSLARLNRDGSPDQDFNPLIRGVDDTADVVALREQTDARIVIGGFFNSVNGVRRNGVARVMPETTPGMSMGFTDLSYAVGEDCGKAVIGVQRFGDTSFAVSVEYATSAGSALPGKDYVETKGTLLFASHQQAKSFIVPIIDNAQRDTNRTINLFLSQVTGGAALIPTLTAATVTIYDNERPGSVDLSFNASGRGLSLSDTLAVQSDGKVLINSGGNLTRLNENGTQDANFTPKTQNYPITSMLLQPDGKMIVAKFGRFSPNTNLIFRLNVDDSVDQSFTQFISLSNCGQLLALQPDGKIIVGMHPDNKDCEAPMTLRRLNADGSLDGSFKPYKIISGWVRQADVSKTGKILLAGYFNSSVGLVQLNSNGSIDTTFRPQISAWVVYSFARQSDDKLVLVGSIDIDSQIAGIANDTIVRLNPNGSRDASFRSIARVNNVAWFAPAPDGKTVVVVNYDANGKGGLLTAGAARRRILARLNADGSLDSEFDIGAGFVSDFGPASVNTIIVQPDGQLLAAGRFISVNGLDRAGMVRLNGGVNYFKTASLVRLPEGPWRLDLVSRPGRAFLLESSIDLRDWLPVGTQTATGFRLEFEDPSAVPFPNRFYRAQLVQP